MNTTESPDICLADANSKEILRCIRQNGPLSRSEICEKTNISKPTMTRATNLLLQEGYLQEIESVKTARGRRPITLDLCQTAAYSFGINISKKYLSIALVDFKLNVVDKEKTRIQDLGGVSQFLDQIADTVLRMQKENGIPDKKILGIGVGAPGLIDNVNGIIRDFAQWGKLRNIHIAEFLQEKTGFWTKVENNCNTWLMGEMWNGYAQGCSNALFILNGEGVGCGIAHHAEIHNIPGGLGHISVDLRGDRCYCGSRGCIETYCSTDSIERKAEEKYASLCKTVGEGKYTLPIDYGTVCQSVSEGDFFFADILLEASTAIACGIVTLIKIFSPEIIILSGNLFEASDFYYNSVVMEIQSQLSFGIAMPRVVRRNVSDALFEIGAATLILQTLF